MSALFIAPVAIDPLVIKSEFDGKSDPTVAFEVIEAVNRVALKHPEVRDTVVTGEPMEKGVYAAAANKKITFNVEYTSDRRRLEASVALDIASRFHPPLGRCSPAELLAYHESAHIIDQAHDREPQRRLNEMYTLGRIQWRDLSGYSFWYETSIFRPGEALAEAFASVQCNGGNATERQIAALLD